MRQLPLGPAGDRRGPRGAGDFNGDGITDVLFRNGASGDSGFYQSNSNGTLQGWHGIGASSTAYNVHS
jgi:hypothetical protein